MKTLDLQSSAGLLQLLADPTRTRLMAILERHELTVAELTAVTELSQSRVSTHLGRLKEAGLLNDRRHGTSTYYRVNDDSMPEEARHLWDALRGELSDPVLESDEHRAEEALRRREGRWPDTVAGHMERHYSPGRTWEALARGLGQLLRLGDVLDIGCGDGTLASLLSARSRSYVGLDRSEPVLSAARHRLGGRPNVRFEHGDAHRLPFGAGAFDEVLLFHVLTYLEDPQEALVEAARVLGPGGRLAIAVLGPHDRLSATAAYGHVVPGVAPATLQHWLERARLRVETCSITSRERHPPHFEVVSALAHRPGGTPLAG
jgi:ArsR family transcriptional regulator